MDSDSRPSLPPGVSDTGVKLKGRFWDTVSNVSRRVAYGEGSARMLKRLTLHNFVIVSQLEIELEPGFSVLTGETGAGKSILVDALQLVLGSRGDAGVVREGAQRAEIAAEFDTPSGMLPWLLQAGFEGSEALLLRRIIDIQGKSRAWVNGSPATVAQLREAAQYLVDIHGQHAWQGLTQSASIRQLLDAFAGIDTTELGSLWTQWKTAQANLELAKTQQSANERERERLVWQISELDKLSPKEGEWQEINTEHQRLANAQALMDAAHKALEHISESPGSAGTLTNRALDALNHVTHFDTRLANVAEVLQGASVQLHDAAHSLGSYLHHAELEPQKLQLLDERLSQWMGLAKRYRCAAPELPSMLVQWHTELRQVEAHADLTNLQKILDSAHTAWTLQAQRISALRRGQAPKLSRAITLSMQQLGMQGGVFEVALLAQTAPQSFGLESAEFLVAGHAGSTPRPLAKVASGGELSRIALAIAVTTSSISRGEKTTGTLIFDEVDSGVGGAVADTVGRLMKQLGQSRQVLAVTHLPQVAACADHHFVVSKAAVGAQTQSSITAARGTERVEEISRMLGGAHLASTSVAHAQEMLAVATDGSTQKIVEKSKRPAPNAKK
jgi:DNA repair protein RecN (Recombination protein N)